MKKSAIFSWILALALISCVMFAGCGNTVGPVGDDIPGTLTSSAISWAEVSGTYTNSYTDSENLNSWFAKYDVTREEGHNPELELTVKVTLIVDAGAKTGDFTIVFSADVPHGALDDAGFTTFAADVATLVSDVEKGFPDTFTTKPVINDANGSADVIEGKLTATQAINDVPLDQSGVFFVRSGGGTITLPEGFNDIVGLPRITLK